MRARASEFPRPLAPRVPWRLGLLIAGLALLAYRSVVTWDPAGPSMPGLGGWFFVEGETAPWVVYLLAGAVLVRRRESLREATRTGAPDPKLAAPFLAVAVGLYLWAARVGAPDLALLSFVLLALGGALLAFGRPVASRLVLPALLMLLALPLPGSLLNQVVFLLQIGSARLAVLILHAVGSNVVREGDVIYGANDFFEVVETCSGLRAMEILTMLSLAYVGLFPSSRLHTVLFVAAAPVVSFLLNGLRVGVLAANPESDVQTMHIAQGIAMFGAGSLAMMGLDRALLRMLPAGSEARAFEPRGPVTRRPALRGSMTALAGLLAALATASLAVPSGAPAARRVAGVTLPEKLGGWTATPLDPDGLFLGSVHFTATSGAVYSRDGQSVTVFLGVDDRRPRRGSIRSPKNLFPGKGWELESHRKVELRPGERVEGAVLRSGSRSVLSARVYQGVDGIGGESLRQALALDDSPWGRRDPAWMLRLSTPLETAPDGIARAEARLREIRREIEASVGV
jgi:exosortase